MSHWRLSSDPREEPLYEQSEPEARVEVASVLSSKALLGSVRGWRQEQQGALASIGFVTLGNPSRAHSCFRTLCLML